jgi:polysaccharide pyruvyl transferase WcaK-like protein
VRIHLGHHFYGAGNVGDDFMLAGFLAAARSLAPLVSFTGSVPFDRTILQARFPQVEWVPYTAAARNTSISNCDVWLGLGGSPFQSAQSRWFIDHLVEEAEICRQWHKPMFYLGVGVQLDAELLAPEIASLIVQAAKIWTRDAESAAKLNKGGAGDVTVAADLAHLFFRRCSPPPPHRSRAVIVANFDYADWPGRTATMDALEKTRATDRVWLAQESRELPGAERTFYATLPPREQKRWRLVIADEPSLAMKRTVADVIQSWPTGEWLITSRYHAALAGAWAGSKIVVIGTNEKLRGVAKEFGLPCISPIPTEAEVEHALTTAASVPIPKHSADAAFEAVRDFLQHASRK